MSGRTTIFGPFELLAPALRKNRGALFVAILAATGEQAVGVPLPLLARRALNPIADRAAEHGIGFFGNSAGWLAIFVVAIVIARTGLRWLQGANAGLVAQRVIADMRVSMYDHLQSLSYGFFQRRASGRLVVRFIGDANALQSWLQRICVGVPADVLTLAILAGAIGAISPLLLLAASIPLVLIASALLWLNPLARRWTREARREQSRLCGRLTERIESAGAIKAMNLQRADVADAAVQIGRIAAANVQRARIEALGDALLLGGATAGVGAVVLLGAWQLGAGAVTHGDLLAILWLTLLARSPLARLARANIVHQRARVAVERIATLLGREVEPGWTVDALPYLGPGRRIRLRDIGYHDAAKRWVLRGVRRTFEGPGLFSISDPGGGGSTLLELLLRLRRPHEGRVYLDGLDIRRLRAADVRRQIGWAPLRPLPIAVLADLCGSDLAAQAAHRAGVIYDALAPDECSAASFNRPRIASGRLETLCDSLGHALTNDPPIVLIDDPSAGLGDEVVTRLIAWLQDLARTRLVLVATNDSRLTALARDRVLVDRPLRIVPPGTAPPDGPNESEYELA